MDYTPCKPKPTALRDLVWAHFGDEPRPASHFSSRLPFYEAEFDASDALDLATASLADIGHDAFYESNTFYNPLGYKYRFPRMFDLICRLGTDARSTDFAGAFFGVPVCCDMPDFFARYSTEQRYCVWLVYDCLDLNFGAMYLFDHDACAINEQNGWPANGLEVIDSEQIEYLSNNLFGTPTPPMDAIRAFGAGVCE
jgi:hypothetical protein